MLIREMQADDISLLVERFACIGWDKPVSLFEMYLEEQQRGERDAFVAALKNDVLGYATLKWCSEYANFVEKGIPEISDLNVLPAFQNNGVGSKLLSHIEDRANTRRRQVGLAVGLTSNYGPAQRLYFKRGYVPDGAGITHLCRPVAPWDTVRADDDLVLWMVKSLKSDRGP